MAWRSDFDGSRWAVQRTATQQKVADGEARQPCQHGEQHDPGHDTARRQFWAVYLPCALIRAKAVEALASNRIAGAATWS
jgi:hypothetical protein